MNFCLAQDTVALWGMSSDHFAQYLLSLGKNGAALEQFRAAHETCRMLVGDSHPQTLVLLNSIGEFTGDVNMCHNSRHIKLNISSRVGTVNLTGEDSVTGEIGKFHRCHR